MHVRSSGIWDAGGSASPGEEGWRESNKAVACGKLPAKVKTSRDLNLSNSAVQGIGKGGRRGRLDGEFSLPPSSGVLDEGARKGTEGESDSKSLIAKTFRHLFSRRHVRVKLQSLVTGRLTLSASHHKNNWRKESYVYGLTN